MSCHLQDRSGRSTLFALPLVPLTCPPPPGPSTSMGVCPACGITPPTEAPGGADPRSGACQRTERVFYRTTPQALPIVKQLQKKKKKIGARKLKKLIIGIIVSSRASLDIRSFIYGGVSGNTRARLYKDRAMLPQSLRADKTKFTHLIFSPPENMPRTSQLTRATLILPRFSFFRFSNIFFPKEDIFHKTSRLISNDKRSREAQRM